MRNRMSIILVVMKYAVTQINPRFVLTIEGPPMVQNQMFVFQVQSPSRNVMVMPRFQQPILMDLRDVRV